MNDNYIKIPGRLSNASVEGAVSGANEIYDDDLQMWQNDINQVAMSGGGGGSVVLPISASDVLDSDLNERQNVINARLGKDGTVIIHLDQDGSVHMTGTKGFFTWPYGEDGLYDGDEISSGDVELFTYMQTAPLLKPMIVWNHVIDPQSFYENGISLIVTDYYISSENSIDFFFKDTATLRETGVTVRIETDAESGYSHLTYNLITGPGYYTKNEVYNKGEIDSMLPAPTPPSNDGAVIIHLLQDGSFYMTGTKGFFKDADGLYDEDEITNANIEVFKKIIGNSTTFLKPMIVLFVDDQDHFIQYYSGSRIVTDYCVSDENSMDLFFLEYTGINAIGVTLEIQTDEYTGDSFLAYRLITGPGYYNKNQVYNKSEIDAMLPLLSLYKCTQAEYDAIVPKDQNVLYIITT